VAACFPARVLGEADPGAEGLGAFRALQEGLRSNPRPLSSGIRSDLAEVYDK
jgi:hypothetical protein